MFLGCGESAEAPPLGATDGATETPEQSDAGDTDGADVADVATLEAASDSQVDAATAEPSILSLNLHCLKNDGTAFTSTRARLAAIADLVAREDVSALAVQEACVKGEEDALAILVAELQRATGRSWSKTWAFAHKAWEGTADEADEGVGVLVRGALGASESLIHRMQSGLARVAISALLPSGLRLYSVHFDHRDAAARTAQAREIAVAALVDTDPGFGAIIAGDFNARAGGDAHGAIVSFGFRDLTASLSPTRIDHVVAHRGSGLAAASARLVLDGVDGPKVSDHPGVLVRLAKVTAEPVTVTRVLARGSLPASDWLSLRGGTAPISWSAGWPGKSTSAGFRFVVTEWSGAAVEAKLLRNDSVWMTGANVKLTPGTDATIDPTF